LSFIRHPPLLMVVWLVNLYHHSIGGFILPKTQVIDTTRIAGGY